MLSCLACVITSKDLLGFGIASAKLTQELGTIGAIPLDGSPCHLACALQSKKQERQYTSQKPKMMHGEVSRTYPGHPGAGHASDSARGNLGG